MTAKLYSSGQATASSDDQFSLPIPAIDAQTLPLIIAAIGQIHFEGNVIPHEWYQQITLDSGKPDLAAITILAEIVYWYRPIRTLDPEGKPIAGKKFADDMFQSSAAYYEFKFGLTKNQTRKALKRLEQAGLIRREYREVTKRSIKLNNVMFIEPVPAKILEITYPTGNVPVYEARPLTPIPPGSEKVSPAGKRELLTGEGVSPVGERVSPVGERVSPVGERVSLISERESPTSETLSLTGETNTETSTETSTKTSQDFSETTTTTTTQAPAQNEAGSSSSSSSSSELIFDFKLATLTMAQRQRAMKILEGLDTEVAQQVLDEFNYAVDCGCIKKSKWAWLQSVARSAREGTFIPTSDLADRRQAQVQTAATPPPKRKPSQVWEEHHEDLLRNGIAPVDYHTYIAPLRGQEDGCVLWLEAPNGIVMDWVLAHMPQIEQVMKPCASLPIRVCIG